MSEQTPEQALPSPYPENEDVQQDDGATTDEVAE